MLSLSKTPTPMRLNSGISTSLKQLPYNIIDFSSQDPQHPINSLISKKINNGWLSNRYCTYPQEIFIQFPSSILLKQINIVINENKIPKMIEFINCIPISDKNVLVINNNKESRYIPSEFNYESIGFIKLSPNSENGFRAREFRKIFVNINSNYLKLKLHRNYKNEINVFCQVGIVKLEFWGYRTKIIRNSISHNESAESIESLCDYEFGNVNVDESFIDEKMDTESKDNLKELMLEMNKKKENEDYDECKKIKDKIDKLRKITLKIYTLEEQKKQYADKNDFDKAKELKNNIDSMKKILNHYIKNKKNDEKNNEKNNENKSNLNSNNNSNSEEKNKNKNNEMDLLEYDEIILPTVMKQLRNNNKSTCNLYSSNFNLEEEKISREPLEEISNDLKEKYNLLICFIGEDGLRKIFSKYIYYKEEGFEILKTKINDIINQQKNTSDTNKYIILLMDILYIFLDDKHPSIVCKCLDIFNNILKALEKKSRENKTTYDFTITKNLINKIKDKLNDISIKVRTKASDLYCLMLDTNFCDYNTLLTDLIGDEVQHTINNYSMNLNKFEIFNKFQLKNYGYFNQFQASYKNDIKSSKQLIITKMGIFLKVLNNYDEAVNKNKTDKQKFPKNVLGDFIIMNINHPKDDVREITRDVMVKFIEIFGNSILSKLKIILDNKDFMKIINDKEEFKLAYDNLQNDNSQVNVSSSVDGIFMTNVNKVFNSNKKKITLRKKKLLLPIGSSKFSKNNANKNKSQSDINISTDKNLVRSESQPKYNEVKNKLKPVIQRNNRALNNSMSQKIFVKSKNKKLISSIK